MMPAKHLVPRTCLPIGCRRALQCVAAQRGVMQGPSPCLRLFSVQVGGGGGGLVVIYVIRTLTRGTTQPLLGPNQTIRSPNLQKIAKAQSSKCGIKAWGRPWHHERIGGEGPELPHAELFHVQACALGFRAFAGWRHV